MMCVWMSMGLARILPSTLYISTQHLISDLSLAIPILIHTHIIGQDINIHILRVVRQVPPARGGAPPRHDGGVPGVVIVVTLRKASWAYVRVVSKVDGGFQLHECEILVRGGGVVIPMVDNLRDFHAKRIGL